MSIDMVSILLHSTKPFGVSVRAVLVRNARADRSTDPSTASRGTSAEREGEADDVRAQEKQRRTTSGEGCRIAKHDERGETQRGRDLRRARRDGTALATAANSDRIRRARALSRVAAENFY